MIVTKYRSFQFNLLGGSNEDKNQGFTLAKHVLSLNHVSQLDPVFCVTAVGNHNWMNLLILDLQETIFPLRILSPWDKHLLFNLYWLCNHILVNKMSMRIKEKNAHIVLNSASISVSVVTSLVNLIQSIKYLKSNDKRAQRCLDNT